MTLRAAAIQFPRVRAPRRVRTLAAALIAVAGACTDPRDLAAKERIFSPEEPAPEIQRAKESIAVGQASTEAVVWTRIWTMDRAEATRRIGAHRATTTTEWKWTRGQRTVSLVEDARFETDAKGDFHTTLTNNEDAGIEFVWADGRAYARGRYGPFRARRIDRAQQDRWRDEGTGALASLFRLFDRRLRASPLGAGRHGDRNGQRFALMLGDPWGEAPPVRDVPPTVYGLMKAGDKLQTGPDEETARRVEFDTRRRPERVTGELLVDEVTGVILKARAKARFSVPGVGKDPESALDVELSFDLAPDDKVAVAAPSNVTAPRMPHAVDEPLSFLGADAPRSAKAGAKGDKPEREDDDDAADPEVPR